ncbi:MAG TPA: integrase family protein [Xanthobacteraceae bacterium]|nr:integrase family protein [Xanthobacteraceae bacterium]
MRELTIRKAKPRDVSYCIWDARQRGLALRVTPTGAKSWKVVYSRHGRPRWLHLGRADAGGIGLADARQIAAKVLVRVAEGHDPAAEKKAERSSGSFGDLAAKYVKEYAERNNKSWRQADALIKRYALPRWSKLQATTITRGDVKTLIAGIDAPILANQVLAAVSAVFTWAMREEILTANPCKLVERNETKSRERVLSESEVPKFWRAFDDLDPTDAAALKAVLLLGQRPGEIANMRREHLDGNWWTMPGAPVPGIWPGTKNGASHRVWIPTPARALLGDTTATGFVFGSRGRPHYGLDRAMRAVCAKLGVERATPHDLRRTHGTTITGLGFGRHLMNRIQNHREGGIADVYDAHTYAAEIKHAMEAVAAKIMGLVEGRKVADNIVPFVAVNQGVYS